MIKKIILLILLFCTIYANDDYQGNFDEIDKYMLRFNNQSQIALQKTKDYGPFLGSMLAMFFAEFGDKTFICSAILAMKFGRLPVFLGSASALTMMTFLACAFGRYLPKLLSPKITSLLASFLFFAFGLKMLYDAYKNEQNEEESKEIEEELQQITKKLQGNVDIQAEKDQAIINIENQNQQNQSPVLNNQSLWQSIMKQKDVCILAFTQVFLGEWGDKSQITQIALAASSPNWFIIFLGCAFGLAFVTFIGVMGGKYLSDKISPRVLNIMGGILMIIFGAQSLYKFLTFDQNQYGIDKII